MKSEIRDQRHRAVRLTDRRRIAQLVERLGERNAADRLMVTPHTLARAAAGFRLHVRTASLLCSRLGEALSGEATK